MKGNHSPCIVPHKHCCIIWNMNQNSFKSMIYIEVTSQIFLFVGQKKNFFNLQIKRNSSQRIEILESLHIKNSFDISIKPKLFSHSWIYAFYSMNRTQHRLIDDLGKILEKFYQNSGQKNEIFPPKKFFWKKQNKKNFWIFPFKFSPSQISPWLLSSSPLSSLASLPQAHFFSLGNFIPTRPVGVY